MKTMMIFSLLLGFFSQATSQTIQTINESSVHLQIFLDNENFTPGKIDGLEKRFTLQALTEYEKALTIQQATTLVKYTPVYNSYLIRKNDKDYIGTVPETPKAQSKKKRVPYATLAEYVAERFHTDVVFLAKLNPDKNMKKLKPGDVLKVPNVIPFQIEKIKKGSRPPSKSEFLKRTIKISLNENRLKLYELEKEIASFPITAGSDENPAPKGTWIIKNINYLPWFRYDKTMLNKGKRSNQFYNIPPGPNNAVGVVWIGLNKKGIGIHGTDRPETIGNATSHGCIRLSNWDVMKLSEMITPGIKVIIDN